MVVINATDSIPLTPRGKVLQRAGQAVGGRHLVHPSPHLHRADHDLQLHALVDLEDIKIFHLLQPTGRAATLGTVLGSTLFVQELVFFAKAERTERAVCFCALY